MQAKTYRKIIISSIIPLIGAVLTLSYNVYQNTEERRTENIRQEIDTKVMQANALNAAMDSIRRQYAIDSYFCNNLHLVTNKNQEIYNLAINHFMVNYKLVQVNYETQLIFGDVVYQKVISFSNLAYEDNYNICSKQVPNDEEMKLLQRQINGLMQQSIQASKKQLDKL